MTNKFSFEQLLTQEIQLTSEKNIKINKISIPILQRDYAQGRKSYYEILDKDEVVLNLAGERFIKEIFSTLESSGELELDFIYGSIYEDKDNDGNLVNVLSPLDGQQRLTTLFLLYWFIGGKELDLTARKKLAEMLKNFTYMTRMSSTFFCADLAKELTKNDASSIFKDGNESIVSQIKNLPWYHGSYNLDPTIDAMLNMLARIQCIYNEKTGDCGKLYENLDKLKFYILPLQDFELSDELYVKMNARGKQLTEFENFKADLQNWLKKLKLGRKKYYNVEMPYDMYFISKMDNEWLQCFWNVGINTDGKNFDRLFLSFFYNFLLNDYVLKENVKNEELAKDPTYIALNKPQYSEFTIFENCLDETLLEKIETFLDNVCKNYKDIQEVCKPSWGDENFDIFKYIFKEEMELKDRTIFSALIFYLTQSAFDKDKLQDWMHFAWNITENANIDSVSVYAGVCILFKGLAKFAKEYAEETKTDKFDIYAVLTQKNIITSSTPAKIAVTEEILKAKLITRDTSWRDALLKAEGHQFFKGSIGFLLPPNEDVDNIDQNEFLHRYYMANCFFDQNGIVAKYREGGHKFLRALLSGYGRRGNSDGLDITYHIADKDENEHSLKKMLSSDAVVKEAVYEWFSLENEEEIAKRLDEEIATSSKISDPLARKLHEELYKKCDLINWMQETGAIRYKEDCISKPNSQIYQIYVKGYRNEIIARMVDKEGWKCKNRCTIKEEENKDPNNVKIKEIPYFWPSREIEVTKELNGQQIVCKFDKENITVVNTSCSYPYAQEVLSEADIDKCINWINKQIQSL